jgi:hypothetical protein
VTSSQGQCVELQQSTLNALQLPIFIAVLLVAVVVRQFIGMPPSATVIGVCVAAGALDALFAWYLLDHTGTMVVTPARITFTRRSGARDGDAHQVIERVEGSALTFRVARNGPMGSKYTGYILMLRDNATGSEAFAGAFGRRKVQQACESQGWTFT